MICTRKCNAIKSFKKKLNSPQSDKNLGRDTKEVGDTFSEAVKNHFKPCPILTNLVPKLKNMETSLLKYLLVFIGKDRSNLGSYGINFIR